MSSVSIDHNTPSQRHSVTQEDDAQLYAVTIRRQIGNTNPAGSIGQKSFSEIYFEMMKKILPNQRHRQRKMFGML